MTLKFKVAVSPLVLSMALAGCSTTGDNVMFKPSGQTAQEARADQSAARSYQLAQIAVQKGETASALGHAEKAVELSPRDAGYRMLLGDLYLKSGRFLSAETSFSDVLILFPDNDRARFNLALTQIALGKSHQALAELDRLTQTASPADLGLAFALAGQSDRAVAMLEPAAREVDADGRVRQNLALAYALSGDWQRARLVAAQDLSPADLGARMEQWATFTQPQSSYTQVASLLGVTPAEDAGQPLRLALAPEVPKSAALAEADTAVEAVATETPNPDAGTGETAVYAEAVQTLIAPERPIPETKSALSQLVSVTAAIRTMGEAGRSPRTRGNYVVQLGAYGSTRLVEHGWSSISGRYGLQDYAPVTARVALPRGVFYRLSIAGFDSRSDATQTCRSIKDKGGACFVRPVAGDAPVRFAARNTRKG